MSINPAEAPAGYIAAPPVSNEQPCRGCAFLAPGLRCSKPDASCVPRERADKSQVIFIENPARVPPASDLTPDGPPQSPSTKFLPSPHYELAPHGDATIVQVSRAMVAMVNAVCGDRLRSLDQIPENLRDLFRQVP